MYEIPWYIICRHLICIDIKNLYIRDTTLESLLLQVSDRNKNHWPKTVSRVIKDHDRKYLEMSLNEIELKMSALIKKSSRKSSGRVYTFFALMVINERMMYMLSCRRENIDNIEILKFSNTVLLKSTIQEHESSLVYPVLLYGSVLSPNNKRQREIIDNPPKIFVQLQVLTNIGSPNIADRSRKKRLILVLWTDWTN